MEVVLSKRMETVVGMVYPVDSNANTFVVADVGCDHAYVSIALIERNIANSVIAMDVRKGPLEIASKNVKQYQMTDKIDLRLGDGLERLSPGEADAVIIAGMGGLLVKSILERGLSKEQRPVLILQPQSDLYEVRKYLQDIGYSIEREKMLIDEGKYYTVIRAVPTIKNNVLDGVLGDDLSVKFTYGAYGLLHKDEVLASYLEKEKDQLESIMAQLEKTIAKQKELNKEVPQKTLERMEQLKQDRIRNKKARAFFNV